MGKLSELRQVDEHSSELVSGFRAPNLVGVGEIFPIVEVNKEAGTYSEYGPDASVIHEGLEQPLGSARKYIDMTVAKGDYRAVKFGLNVPLYDEEREEAADPEEWEDRKAELGASIMQLLMEKTISSYISNPANYDPAYTEALVGGAKWSDYVNSDPLGDVTRWLSKEELVQDCESDELNVAVGPLVAGHARQHPQLKVTAANGDSKNPSLADLAAKFNCKEVKVLRGKVVQNFDPKDPRATLFMHLWGNIIVVYRKLAKPVIDAPLWGAITRRKGYPIVEDYRNNDVDADVKAHKDKWGLTVRSNKRGFLATDVI